MGDVFSLPDTTGTECCGAKISSVTHLGAFCAACDRPVYIWNGLLRTREREKELYESLAQALGSAHE